MTITVQMAHLQLGSKAPPDKVGTRKMDHDVFSILLHLFHVSVIWLWDRINFLKSKGQGSSRCFSEVLNLTCVNPSPTSEDFPSKTTGWGFNLDVWKGRWNQHELLVSLQGFVQVTRSLLTCGPGPLDQPLLFGSNLDFVIHARIEHRVVVRTDNRQDPKSLTSRT